MGRQVLDLPETLQHEQLRHDGQRLEDDTKIPQNFQPQQSAEAVVRDLERVEQRDDGARCHGEEPVFERIMRSVVFVLPRRAEVDRINDRRRRCDEGDLHKGVVQAVEVAEQVRVARHEYY